MRTLADRKRAAHRAFKEAQAKLDALKTKGATRDELKRSRKALDRRRKAWREAIEMEKAAKPDRKLNAHEKRLGEKTFEYPEPEGFRIVHRPKDFYRAVIDPSWTPTPEQRRMIGKYVFPSFHEKGPVQAIVGIHTEASDSEIQTLLIDYFDREESRLFYGNVKILSVYRSERPRKSKYIDVTILTDHREIRGFITPPKRQSEAA